ncbi:hypothetical protein BDV25DRAFT_143832 [Aspergillus avenaceus]|uniref:DNA polymerase n=1 Tax=Aspergillus avenaceus TaxID=36643 RepID=A0A5N6TIX1_ASPAV|nr:hypothetical protein BDV25DRAFT_143832 [Aspergillus avenaceus]
MSDGSSISSHDGHGPSFTFYPAIYVLPTHLSLESLHRVEECLLNRDARLTYDPSEARVFLGNIGQRKRAILELRSRGVCTELEMRSVPGGVHVDGALDLGTETESDGQTNQSTGHLKRARSSDAEVDGSFINSDLIRVVRLGWLEKCVEEKDLVPMDQYIIYQGRRVQHPDDKATKGSEILHRAQQDVSRPHRGTTHRGTTHRPPKLYKQSTSENEDTPPPAPDWVTNHVSYACMRSAPLHPPNERFIDQLVKIRKVRELTLDEIGVRAYSTSIAAIAAYPCEFRRASEVLALPGCDMKIANLFAEFQQSGDGSLVAASALDTDPVLRVLHHFYRIWGVGAKTARDFYYARQWRDLDDIVEHGWNSLSRVQQIGVKYYDELLEGIPRAEVEEIARVVHRHASAVRPGVECIVVGGYRRGKEASGDADLVLSHRDESATHNLVVDVVSSLETEGWITHTLALHLTTSTRDQQTLPLRHDTGNHFDTLDKALVVWQDPSFNDTSPSTPEKKKRNPNPHRRVDIIISPWRTVGCAVLGWSGDTTFERDLRRHAKKSRGWKFDSSGVRERTSGGQVIDLERGGETWQEREKLVMEGLGIGWRPPGERCTR